ncbi:MAG: hypothetical protein HOQ24_17550 [Mycobacteriaceae bacterium]|nr:hypothetical protein [Mycobacteriaceae bacterium]
MSTRRITLTLPEELVASAEQAVREGRARSVSAYVASAAGAGEARMSFAEVMSEWQASAGDPTPEQSGQVDEWMAGFVRRQRVRDAALAPPTPPGAR